ncbi:hypothetical protein WJX73_008833 [Symbiochloris irregularis]|uniref:Ran guanine nucleotide release factor n=1 Tax=Symbiochloris irregularis TaxID=706552 RepID=A0AAW1NXX1_9CHLO
MPTLFGGAIELELPERFEDISSYRDVPDNQEVFTDGDLDQSVIVEILERAPVDDAESAEFLFRDYASEGEASSCTVQTCRRLDTGEIPLLPAGTDAFLATGVQRVAKQGDSKELGNELQVLLAVVRLPQVNSDILITLNTPIYINPASRTAKHVAAGHQATHEHAPAEFAALLTTFTVLDWGLFGSPQ